MRQSKKEKIRRKKKTLKTQNKSTKNLCLQIRIVCKETIRTHFKLLKKKKKWSIRREKKKEAKKKKKLNLLFWFTYFIIVQKKIKCVFDPKFSKCNFLDPKFLWIVYLVLEFSKYPCLALEILRIGLKSSQSDFFLFYIVIWHFRLKRYFFVI